MKISLCRRIATLGTGVLSLTLLAAGCQESTTYETRKPVVEDSAAEEAGEALEEAGEDASEAMSDAADAVTPDEPIVDIQTPLGDVFVGEDPITGDKSVDVDTPRARVDVDNE